MSYQKPEFKNKYENYIGGKWVAPVDGEYFDNISPVDGSVIAKVARSNGKDIDLAVAAALKAAKEWGKTSVTERSNLLFRIADRIESVRSERQERRERAHKRRLHRLIPLLIFGTVAVLIAKQEIPAVDSWISRQLNAEAWNAGEACRQAALGRLEQPDFARLLKAGKVEQTSGGYYIEGILYAVLQSSGEELHFRYSCNVTATGEVVTIKGE